MLFSPWGSGQPMDRELWWLSEWGFPTEGYLCSPLSTYTTKAMWELRPTILQILVICGWLVNLEISRIPEPIHTKLEYRLQDTGVQWVKDNQTIVWRSRGEFTCQQHALSMKHIGKFGFNYNRRSRAKGQLISQLHYLGREMYESKNHCH